jgi:hypothetical protein
MFHQTPPHGDDARELADRPQHRAGTSTVRADSGPRTAIAIAVALAVGLLVLAGTALIAWRFDQPFGNLARDVTSVAGVPWHTGLLSLLTLLVWAAVTAVTSVAAWLVPAQRLRLAVLAAFVLVVLLDDAFLLHEGLGPENGVPQGVFLVVYAGAGVAVATMFLRRPWTGVTVSFFVGGALLGLSLAVDVVFGDVYAVEDGAKLLGALVWLTVPVLALRPRSTSRSSR